MKKAQQPKQPPTPTPSRTDRRFFLFSAAFFLITVLAAVFIFGRGTPVDTSQNSGGSSMQSGAASGLTLPQMTEAYALSGSLDPQRGQLKTLVDACADYRPERRSQMQTHLLWLEHPDQIPADLMPAFGANPVGRLIFGMATYTSSEWKLLDSPAESCLLPIGRLLNDMLIASGETPFEEFN